MKAGGANRIRYPGSPSCKRCRLGDGPASCRLSAAGKPLSLPPGNAVARLKLKGIGGGAPQGVKPAVQLESTPEILPGATAE